MAKKKAHQKAQHELSPEQKEHLSRVEHMREEHQNVKYTSSYKLTLLHVNEMAQLLGHPDDKGILTMCTLMGCLAMVALLVTNPNNPIALGVSFVLVAVDVLLMALTTGLLRFKTNWLQRHGYDIQTMSDKEVVRDLYVTPSEIIVDVPGIKTETYPFSELKRARGNDDYILADFGNARLAFFPRKTLSLNDYHGLMDLLNSKTAKQHKGNSK